MTKEQQELEVGAAGKKLKSGATTDVTSIRGPMKSRPLSRPGTRTRPRRRLGSVANVPQDWLANNGS